jgi:hypothetical protein
VAQLRVGRHEVAHDAQDELGLVGERADDLVPLQERSVARASMHAEVALGVALLAQKRVRGRNRVPGHRPRP